MGYTFRRNPVSGLGKQDISSLDQVGETQVFGKIMREMEDGPIETDWQFPDHDEMKIIAASYLDRIPAFRFPSPGADDNKFTIVVNWNV